jgi:hypothetical protein
MSGTKLVVIFWLCLIGSLSASAQTADSTKKDSVKIDTALLNKYRLYPRKNALPVRVRAIQIQPELIPVSMLDYKVNYWKKWITLGINFSQSAFTGNYSAGGVSAIALGSNLIYKTEYNKAPFSYTGELNLIYGKSKNKGQGSRKTNDRIFIDNKIASQLSKHWFFFGSLSFESQFDKGFQYTDAGGVTLAHPLLLSNLMSPGYLTESIGFEYKPAPYFSMRFGTGTARQTFVLDTTIHRNQPANYGVPIGKRFKNELAFQIVSTIDKDLMTNLHINARYALFIPYEKSLAYVTHRIDALLAARVNRLISVTMNGTFLYDKTTSNQVQGTEGIALGVIYKFP